MAGETPITIVGNLVDDPEMRFNEQSGIALANFTIASTPRNFSRETNRWEDGEAMFIRCTVWRDAAQNVAESLKKGMRVIATGHLSVRRYEKRDGSTGVSVEMKNVEVGPSLRYATAQVERNPYGGSNQYGGGSSGGQGGFQQNSGYGYSSGGSQGGNRGFGGPQGGSDDDPWASSERPADSNFDAPPPF